jgi:F0F1-type ATP synthase membrane subunit c/vacuolar-type H+-ATPase subunit K
MEVTRAERSRALWRRQAWLTLLVAGVFGIVALLITRVSHASSEAAARQRLSLPAANYHGLVIALVTAGVVLVALLCALCLHAYRIATLTFSRPEEHH